MTTLLILMIPSWALAQNEETDVFVIEDVILKESLRKQGNAAELPARFQQRQVQPKSSPAQKQEEVSPEQIKILKQQITQLQKEMEALKEQRQQDKTSIPKLVIAKELKDPKVMGDIGRFRITEGEVSAQTKRMGMDRERRQIPALQICTTMADINRMDSDDLSFLGFDQNSAKDIIEAREKLGDFKSSKQLEAIAGVDKNLINSLKDNIIAIREQRLAE